ncbi:hypothetical protein, partial [Leptospira wolffii]
MKSFQKFILSLFTYINLFCMNSLRESKNICSSELTTYLAENSESITVSISSFSRKEDIFRQINGSDQQIIGTQEKNGFWKLNCNPNNFDLTVSYYLCYDCIYPITIKEMEKRKLYHLYKYQVEFLKDGSVSHLIY